MTKAKVIFSKLRKDILGGVYSEGTLIPSEKEVCQRFSVSRITARAALKMLEEEHLVVSIPKRGRRVLLPQAAMCRRQQVITVFGAASDYVRECYAGIRCVLDQKQYANRFFPIHDLKDCANEIPAEVKVALSDGKCDGVIIISNIPLGLGVTSYLEDFGVPWLQAGLEGDLEYDCVCMDNALGAEMMVDRLVELGHRRITYFHSPSLDYLPTFTNRMSGYLRAMQRHGLEPDCACFTHPEYFGMPNSDRCVQRMLRLGEKDKSSCVLCMVRPSAMGVFLTRMGYHVPNDISLCGFDRESRAELDALFPCDSITHIEDPIEDVGKVAAQRLVHMMLGEREPVRQIKIRPRLFSGDTVMQMQEPY